jgi:hypothetical protein
MTRRTALGLVGTSVVFGIALAGCSAHVDGPPTAAPATTTTASATPTSTASAAPTEAEARTELQAYLDAWRTDGPASASRAYLTADQQVPDDADAPHLRSGKVTGVTDAEPTSDGQRFLATLELSFDGNPAAWGEGTNDRFVTFTPRAGAIPYEMAFATSP